MAFSTGYGLESTRCGVATSCSALDGGAVGLGSLNLLTVKKPSSKFWIGGKEKGGKARVRVFADRSGQLSSCLLSSCPCSPGRVSCAADLRTCGASTLDDEVVEQVVFFQPPLGWPFSQEASTDTPVIGKGRNFRVEKSLSLLYSDEKSEDVGVSDTLEKPSTRKAESLYQTWIATEFFAAVQSGSPPPRQKQESLERDNYYVNTGYAIRTLREELPNLFYKELTFDIYRDDISFQDPMNTFSGIDNYKLIFWALRFHGRIFFKAIWVDILRVWQPHDKVIMVRWTVRGIPRVPWEAQGRFDGTSEYKLDKDGKIYAHKVDNVIFNSPPTFQAQNVLDLVRVAGGQTTPTLSFCGRAGLMFVLLSPYLYQFTWVRFYWALKSTLALNNAGEWCSEFGLSA